MGYVSFKSHSSQTELCTNITLQYNVVYAMGTRTHIYIFFEADTPIIIIIFFLPSMLGFFCRQNKIFASCKDLCVCVCMRKVILLCACVEKEIYIYPPINRLVMYLLGG